MPDEDTTMDDREVLEYAPFVMPGLTAPKVTAKARTQENSFPKKSVH